MELKKLEEIVRKATQRERIAPQIKTLAIYLYFNGLSLRVIAQVLQYLDFKVSHEAIKK